MKTTLLFLHFLIPLVVFAQITQIGNDINGEEWGDWSGFSVSLSADGNTVAIGALYNDGNGDNSGHVRVYRYNGSFWTQKGDDINGEAAQDNSGKVSISADGNIVAIGARFNDDNGVNSGHVRVYQYSGGDWIQLGDDIDGESDGNWSGFSVSLSDVGSIVAIGAPNNYGSGSHSGHVRVYQFSGGSWTQVGDDIDGEAAGDESGSSVSLNADGNLIAIGAPSNNGNGPSTGHVRIYQNTGGNWTQIGQDINGEAAYDWSGRSISLSADGSIVAIGSSTNDGNGEYSGHVRVYQNMGGTWDQIGQDIDGESEHDSSGSSVSLSDDGTILAIGAPENSDNGSASGHVRIYKNTGGTWTQIGEDIDGEAASDLSGISVSLNSDGSNVAIGAHFNDGNGSNSGHVRVFDLSSVLGYDENIALYISIYPNPVSDLLTIDNTSNTEITAIKLYDVLGRLVLTQKGNVSEIDVSHLNSGVLFVEIETDRGVITKKIVKE